MAIYTKINFSWQGPFKFVVIGWWEVVSYGDWWLRYLFVWVAIVCLWSWKQISDIVSIKKLTYKLVLTSCSWTRVQVSVCPQRFSGLSDMEVQQSLQVQQKHSWSPLKNKTLNAAWFYLILERISSNSNRVVGLAQSRCTMCSILCGEGQAMIKG